MKKSINIGLILFLLLQACASEENSSTQPVVETIAEDTPINEPAEPNNPPHSKTTTHHLKTTTHHHGKILDLSQTTINLVDQRVTREILGTI